MTVLILLPVFLAVRQKYLEVSFLYVRVRRALDKV